ncbi:MAG: carboxypeptidase-like regulatory domain-containing protein, partial [Terriglobia bacterium]
MILTKGRSAMLAGSRRNSIGIIALVMALLAIGAGSMLFGQVAGGTFTGTVTDPSGAVIPNVKVIITNTATGVSHATATNASGLYTVPNLVPGRYTITA